jgi:hypothetical protein
MRKINYAGYRFPPEIIRQAIWLYLRFTLSLRDVEDLLAERGIAVSYETVRRWVYHFGPRPTAYARYIVLHTYMEEDRDMLLVTFYGEPSGRSRGRRHRHKRRLRLRHEDKAESFHPGTRKGQCEYAVEIALDGCHQRLSLCPEWRQKGQHRSLLSEDFERALGP